MAEDRKQQILKAAISVFSRQGFHEARMDDIAQECGVSKGTLYLYYKSKDDLILRLLEQAFSEQMAAAHELIDSEGTVHERLMQLVTGLAAYMQQSFNDLLPIAGEFYALAGRRDDVREYLLRYFQEYRTAIAALLQQGIDNGEFASFDADKTALTLVILFEGAALLWFTDPKMDLTSSTEHAVRLILAGLKCP